jgi:SAM-dependent methyltransferase
VADLPLDLTGELADRLLRALDREGKIVRALDALGPVVDRDVFVVDPGGGVRANQLAAIGARLASVPVPAGGTAGLPDASMDAVVAFWSAFRAPSPDEVAEADRVLRQGGRLLVLHDYGRDDVSRLRGDLPEYGSWSKRDGWYLRTGFRMRVIHCFWTFDTLVEAHDFLEPAFGQAGAAMADSLKRPRLSYNVAIYHRTRGDETSRPPGPTGRR